MKREIIEMGKLERLIITCGGTGGHFYPGLSIAREFQSQGGKVLLLLSGVNSEAQAATAAKYDIEAVVLPVMPAWNRHLLRFISGALKGWMKARKVIREFAPQVILGMGSFAMTPVLLSGWFAGIPLALHDGNARIGRGNRIFSRFAKVLGAGFPPVNPDKCRCRIADTGMPVRPELLNAEKLDRNEALKKLNELFDCDLKEDLTTILIFGGSQGAAVFNKIIPEALLKCGDEEFQVLHLCGKGKKLDAEKLYCNADFPVLLLESSDKMEYFLAAADAVFCRSGGSTLAELALFGKGAYLIPYPSAAEGHQLDNAEYFERDGAAKIIINDELTTEKVCGLLKEEICSNSAVIAERGKAAAQLARPDAAKLMLEEISAIIVEKN